MSQSNPPQVAYAIARHYDINGNMICSGPPGYEVSQSSHSPPPEEFTSMEVWRTWSQNDEFKWGKNPAKKTASNPGGGDGFEYLRYEVRTSSGDTCIISCDHIDCVEICTYDPCCDPERGTVASGLPGTRHDHGDEPIEYSIQIGWEKELSVVDKHGEPGIPIDGPIPDEAKFINGNGVPEPGIKGKETLEEAARGRFGTGLFELAGPPVERFVNWYGEVFKLP